MKALLRACTDYCQLVDTGFTDEMLTAAFEAVQAALTAAGFAYASLVDAAFLARALTVLDKTGNIGALCALAREEGQ